MTKDSGVAVDSLHAEELALPPDDFLPDEPEGAAFHKAFQASGIAGFDCRYLAIFRNGQRVAVVPYFLNTFSIGTLLPDGLLKKSFGWIKFRIACVGHPSTDFGMIDGDISADILALVNATLRDKAPLLAYKGFADNLPLPGFTKVRGLPVSVLAINGDYYSALDARRRKDLRRKLKKAEPLRFEESDGLPEHLAERVYRLYLNTYERSSIRFERLTPEYFQQTASLGKYLLWFEGERLIGFAQLLCKRKKMVGKYIGMDYGCNRRYRLYFLLCLKAIEACVRDGYASLDLGVTSYRFKRLLGGEQVETSIYYRHNNALVNRVLGKLKCLLEPAERELR